MLKQFKKSVSAIFHKIVDSGSKTSAANACTENMFSNFIITIRLITYYSQIFREIRQERNFVLKLIYQRQWYKKLTEILKYVA